MLRNGEDGCTDIYKRESAWRRCEGGEGRWSDTWTVGAGAADTSVETEVTRDLDAW